MPNFSLVLSFLDFSTIWPDEGTIIRDGIKPFSYYAIFVTTLIVRQGIQGGQDIKSAASEIVYFQTPPSHPEAPEDLQVNSVNYSTVNITWTEPKRPNGKFKSHYNQFRIAYILPLQILPASSNTLPLFPNFQLRFFFLF